MLWNNRKNNHPTEDEDEDMPKTFEDIVEDGLDDLRKIFTKLEKRIEAIEKDQEDRIARLERDAQRKHEYIEMLLSKLLDQYVSVPLATASKASPIPGKVGPVQNGQQAAERQKLASPKPGAVLP